MRSDIEPQSRVRLAAFGQDEHHGPVDVAEAAAEGFFVGEARRGTGAWMSVQPDAAELFWFEPGIHLLVVEVGDGFIVELHRDRRALLTYQADVFDQQQIIGRRDGEATDLGVAGVAQVQQFRPGVRCEPDRGSVRPSVLASRRRLPVGFLRFRFRGTKGRFH